MEQGEPVLGGDRGLEQRDEVAHGDERAIQSAAPDARAASSSCAIAAKRAGYSTSPTSSNAVAARDLAAQDGDVLVTGDVEWMWVTKPLV